MMGAGAVWLRPGPVSWRNFPGARRPVPTETSPRPRGEGVIR